MAKEFPSTEEILEFISESKDSVHKSEIAKAFHIKGDERIILKQILRDLVTKELIVKAGSKNYKAKETLSSETCVLEVAHIDPDGELIGYPVKDKSTKVYISSKAGDIKVGDRITGKCRKDEASGHYEATDIKKIKHRSEDELICVYKSGDKSLTPTDRRNRKVYFLEGKDAESLSDGDIVMAKTSPSSVHETHEKVTVLRKIADKNDPHAISLISINTYEIPNDFSKEAMDQAKDNAVPELGDREDLRNIPLVTIDGADARDFDDAVYAKETADGFDLIVAIADVSYYVKANTTLDNEAYDRGNSTYFPDRVVPMLPEGLSNNMCSLMPHVDRACMACHIKIDKEGNIKKHHFTRALMNSKARLTYEQAQNGIDFHLSKSGINKKSTPPLGGSQIHSTDLVGGNDKDNQQIDTPHSIVADSNNPDSWTLPQGESNNLQLDSKVAPIMDDVIIPLYKAFQAFLKARTARQSLELDLPEREVKLDRKTNTIESITVKTRYESMKLIEEFMVAANVAAAETLEKSNCIYRVHDKPDPERLTNVRAFIKELGYDLTSKEAITSKHLNHLLKEVKGKPEAPLVNEIILRSQSQAVYGSLNIGHFGLSLEKYAHFTSPIRRYADLIVHRSLTKELKLGDGALTETEINNIEEISDHLSITERRSIAAERDSTARYIAMYLSNNIGAEFYGRISGVSNKGLFVELDETGADGLIPMRRLVNDYYTLDEVNHCLVGRRSGVIYRLTAKIKVKIEEASGINGSSIFSVVDDKGADIPWAKDRKIPGAKQRTFGKRRSSGKKYSGKSNNRKRRR